MIWKNTTIRCLSSLGVGVTRISVRSPPVARGRGGAEVLFLRPRGRQRVTGCSLGMAHLLHSPLSCPACAPLLLPSCPALTPQNPAAHHACANGHSHAAPTGFVRRDWRTVFGNTQRTHHRCGDVCARTPTLRGCASIPGAADRTGAGRTSVGSGTSAAHPAPGRTPSPPERVAVPSPTLPWVLSRGRLLPGPGFSRRRRRSRCPPPPASQRGSRRRSNSALSGTPARRRAAVTERSSFPIKCRNSGL